MPQQRRSRSSTAATSGKRAGQPRLAKGLRVPVGTKSRAWFSRDRRHRWLLIRELTHPTEEERRLWRVVLFVLLNPSAATHLVDDRTIAKCWRLTRRWGGTEMRICNVYGIRATDPSHLRECEDPVGRGRDPWLRKAAEGFGTGRRSRQAADVIVAAWGNHAQPEALRGVRAILAGSPRLVAFGTTASGAPTHPLYVPEAKQPQPFAFQD